MRYCYILHLLLINSFCLFSQDIEHDKQTYSIIPILKNEMDTSQAIILAHIEVGKNIKSSKIFLISLISKTKGYTLLTDTLTQFYNTFIEPGTYKITARSLYNKGFESIYTTLDSTTFNKGGIYYLQIRKGSFKPDSCCYVGKQIILPIHFQLGSYDLADVSKFILNDISKFIMDHRLTIEIAVHNDERSNELYKSTGICTSCKRAEIIKNYMITQGIDPSRIIAIGHQGYKPYFINAKTEEQHQLNRRTVVTILSNKN